MASGKSRPGDQTTRLLFGSASRCAFPNCTELLVHRYGEIMTVTVEIAHIRSEKPRGPRHVPGYEPVHEFENLLLLCLKHHVRHEALFHPSGGERTSPFRCRSKETKLRAA
jgi:hypothetical protein